MRKRKGIRKMGNHKAEDMLRALISHREGSSLRQAGIKNNVKFVTLRRYAKKYQNVKTEDLKNQRLTPNYSVNKIFSEEHEKMLKTFLLECADKMNGISCKEMRKAAYEMAVAYGIDIPEAWKKNKIAGIEWFLSFRKRNEISPKKPQNNCRADPIDVEAVKAFCDDHKIEVPIKDKRQFVFVKDFQVMAAPASPDGTSMSAVDVENLKTEEDEAPVSLWSYFEREPNGRACCAICRSVVARAEMTAHMRDHHPKLVFETTLASEDEVSDTQEDVYTEIVYLEDEAKRSTPKPEKKKRPSFPEKHEPKPRKRHVSESSDDEPLKQKVKKDNEIEHFAKYITCLLNKLPTEACMELQMEIVNLIMKKQLELKKKEAEAKMVERNGESSRIDMDSSAT